MPTNSSEATYLVIELAVRDWDKLNQYSARALPLMREHGGRVVAMSRPSDRAIEGQWSPDLLIVHRWESLERFEAFWNSPRYAPLKRLRNLSRIFGHRVGQLFCSWVGSLGGLIQATVGSLGGSGVRLNRSGLRA